MTESEAATAFLKLFSQLESAFPVVTFGYIAVRAGDENLVIASRLTCRTDDVAPTSVNVESQNIIAGLVTLSDPGLKVPAVVAAMLEGELVIDERILSFPPNADGKRVVSYVPLHPEGRKNQSRLSVLRITGSEALISLPDETFDWELRAAPIPYESLQELATDCLLMPLDWKLCTFEAVIPTIAVVEYSSTVTPEVAKPRVRLRNGLDKAKLSIGFRVFSGGSVSERGSIKPEAITWDPPSTGSAFQVGTAEVAVPSSSVVQCFVVYDGVTQHFGWISDGTVAQNPRRAVLELSDPKLEITSTLLRSEAGKGNSRDLEAAVSWLLWLLGFSPVHLGATTTVQNSVDILAQTPGGNFCLIECTTGMIRPDNKLSQLVGRATECRKKLQAVGVRYPHLLSVMATSKPRDEISQDLEYAERLGVLVLAREDLLRMLDGTLVLRDPDLIFVEAEKQVQLSQARFASEVAHDSLKGRA